LVGKAQALNNSHDGKFPVAQAENVLASILAQAREVVNTSQRFKQGKEKTRDIEPQRPQRPQRKDEESGHCFSPLAYGERLGAG
ncbi:MAG: hypothetical protein ABI700_31705, partial [Chloroflexota bacterium]